ncbi:MAG: hypothetical protein ACOCQ4_00295 [bacterium]
MKKLTIHIISRVIHPVQSPRSFRTIELANELARQGHDVTVYAVLGNYDYSDYEKETGVTVKNIGKMIFATKNSDGKTRYNLLDKILFHSFNKLLDFPDSELMFKINKVLKRTQNVDLLITIAKPYTIHWGAALRKSFNYNNFPEFWIADCGDPYMGSAFTKHPFYFKYIEKWFCRKADFLTIPIEEAKEGYYKEFHPKIRIIPQGFKFEKIEAPNMQKKNSVPTFIYAGNFIKDGRDPGSFLNFLSTLQVDFRFKIFTKSKSFVTPYLDKLGEKVELNDFIPRTELLQEMTQANFLVNFDNGTSKQSPSKLIDYAIVNKPVLNVNGSVYNNNHLVEFLNGNYRNQLIIKNIDQYKIENVAKNFLDLYYNNL